VYLFWSLTETNEHYLDQNADRTPAQLLINAVTGQVESRKSTCPIRTVQAYLGMIDARSDGQLKHPLPRRRLSRESDYLIGLRDVAHDALREAGVEFVGVFSCEEIRNVLFGLL